MAPCPAAYLNERERSARLAVSAHYAGQASQCRARRRARQWRRLDPPYGHIRQPDMSDPTRVASGVVGDGSTDRSLCP